MPPNQTPRPTRYRNCRYCKKPIRQLYPDAEPELQWAHLNAEDAADCPVRDDPDKWPAPDRALYRPTEVVGKRIRMKDYPDWRGRIVSTSELPDGRFALHVQWDNNPPGMIGITFPHLVEIDTRP